MSFVSFTSQIIRELREEVDRLKRLLAAKIAGKSHIVEPGETTIEIEEMLSESEKLMSECTMTWEQKEKQTQQIQQVRQRAVFLTVVIPCRNVAFLVLLPANIFIGSVKLKRSVLFVDGILKNKSVTIL